MTSLAATKNKRVKSKQEGGEASECVEVADRISFDKIRREYHNAFVDSLTDNVPS